MLVFIVPVKSEKVASDWKHFCKLFERSIGSICQQTDSNFEVVVVCHEIPEIDFKHPKIHYITVDFPPPIQTDEEEMTKNANREVDKSRKVLIGAKYAEKFNPNHIMVVDSDDCISNKIAKFVNKDSNKEMPGWYFKKGYVYREGRRFIVLNRFYFNVLCGTSAIFKPELLDDMFRKEPYLFYDHGKTKVNNTIELTPLPFPGAIYSMGNGENHYMSDQKVKDLNTHSNLFSFEEIKRIYKKLMTYRFRLVSKSFKRRFNLYEIS